MEHRRPSVSASMASVVSSETTPLLVEPASEWRETSPKRETRDGHKSLLSDDPDNPLEWSPRFKSGIVALLAATAFIV